MDPLSGCLGLLAVMFWLYGLWCLDRIRVAVEKLVKGK